MRPEQSIRRAITLQAKITGPPALDRKPSLPSFAIGGRFGEVDRPRGRKVRPPSEIFGFIDPAHLGARADQARIWVEA